MRGKHPTGQKCTHAHGPARKARECGIIGRKLGVAVCDAQHIARIAKPNH
jgi:hypothetical protein